MAVLVDDEAAATAAAAAVAAAAAAAALVVQSHAGEDVVGLRLLWPITDDVEVITTPPPLLVP